MVGERRLAGGRLAAAADDGGRGGRVVWVPPRNRFVCVAHEAGARVDGGHLQGLGFGEFRQQIQQAAGQHGLADAGRADHEEVVATGSGHLQGPLGGSLALHQAQQIDGRLRFRPCRGGGRLRFAWVGQQREHVSQVSTGNDRP